MYDAVTACNEPFPTQRFYPIFKKRQNNRVIVETCTALLKKENRR